MSGGRICVITVVLNAAGALPQTIESVLAQKARHDLDYIIIDGGSTDGSVEIIKSHAKDLRHWVSEPDGGVYHAMNKGWEAAPQGSFILFLGAGDRILSLPEDLAAYGKNDVLYGSVLCGEDRVFRSRTGLHLKLYNSLHHQALLVNKGCHPQPPFDTRYRLYADFDFNQRLLKGGARLVPAPGFAAYALPGGVSDRSDFAESLRVIRKNFGLVWAALAVLACAAVRALPALRRMGPFQKRFVA